jgi:hypothetical protein
MSDAAAALLADGAAETKIGQSAATTITKDGVKRIVK